MFIKKQCSLQTSKHSSLSISTTKTLPNKPENLVNCSPDKMSFPITLHGATEREQIVDAIYRILAGIDTNDIKLYESGWASRESAVFDFNGTVMTGLDAIHEGIFKKVGPLTTTHFVTNTRIDAVEGAKEAKVSCNAMAQHYRPSPEIDPKAERLLSGSMYFCDVVKGNDGVWRVSRWTMKLLWMEGDLSIVA